MDTSKIDGWPVSMFLDRLSPGALELLTGGFINLWKRDVRTGPIFGALAKGLREEQVRRLARGGSHGDGEGAVLELRG